MLEFLGEPLVKGLFGIGALGGQSDEGGDAFQGEERFPGQGAEPQEQIGHRYFSRAAAQESGGSGQRLGIQRGQRGAQMDKRLNQGVIERI